LGSDICQNLQKKGRGGGGGGIWKVRKNLKKKAQTGPVTPPPPQDSGKLHLRQSQIHFFWVNGGPSDSPPNTRGRRLWKVSGKSGFSCNLPLSNTWPRHCPCFSSQLCRVSWRWVRTPPH